MNQRWLYGQDRYRPAGETINTRLYDVAPIGTKQAKAFVQTHHYSGPNSWVYDRFRFGLFTAGRLVGCAVFSHPVNEKIFSFFPGSVRQSVELGRFVLLDEVPGNGETFFLGQCFDQLRRAVDTTTGEQLDMQGVVSFSDPSARTTATGALVFAGHLGTIYAAHNATYVGRATPRTLRLWPDGHVVNSRRLQKIRSGEKGATPAIQELRSFGADDIWDDRAAWLNHWLDRLTRRLHHPGNHKYLWGLSRRAKLLLPDSLAYPKTIRLNSPTSILQ
jgi:hypothetical protein